MRRLAAGVYETLDGGRRIIRVEHEQVGPRGGSAVVWESAAFDDVVHAWVLDSEIVEPTLRRARAKLQAMDMA